MRQALLATALLLSGCATARVGEITDPGAAFMADWNAQSPLTPEDGYVVRITRDYNNDGRPDQAFAPGDYCGAGSYSTGCEFALYLQDSGGGYHSAGLLSAHGEAAPLEPLRHGVARLINCVAHRETPTTRTTQIINANNVTDESGAEIAAEEEERLCGERETAPVREEARCEVSDYLAAGACSWRSLAW